MKIIVDAMGGDNAPLEIVRGALDANRNHGVEIILVGRTAEVLKAVEACGQKSRVFSLQFFHVFFHGDNGSGPGQCIHQRLEHLLAVEDRIKRVFFKHM